MSIVILIVTSFKKHLQWWKHQLRVLFFWHCNVKKEQVTAFFFHITNAPAFRGNQVILCQKKQKTFPGTPHARRMI